MCLVFELVRFCVGKGGSQLLKCFVLSKFGLLHYVNTDSITLISKPAVTILGKRSVSVIMQ